MAKQVQAAPVADDQRSAIIASRAAIRAARILEMTNADFAKIVGVSECADIAYRQRYRRTRQQAAEELGFCPCVYIGGWPALLARMTRRLAVG